MAKVKTALFHKEIFVAPKLWEGTVLNRDILILSSRRANAVNIAGTNTCHEEENIFKSLDVGQSFSKRLFTMHR